MKASTCFLAISLLLAGRLVQAEEKGPFQRQWTYVSETSAVVYWQLDDIQKDALSYVEYGRTPDLRERTPTTTEPRWSHFHRLTGLEPNAAYAFRMVAVDPKTKAETKSSVLSFTTKKNDATIRVPEQVQGPPFVLDKAGATYVLTKDVTADGQAIVITGSNVTLDLDGHTVVFGNNTAEQISGVLAKNTGKATICNGHVVQGARSKAYSTAVESRWRPEPTEIFGISTDVHLPCAYPVKFLGKAANSHIHHNLLYSRVTEVESRHYPGNDLLRLDISDGHVEVNDNLLTEGCHLGIRLTGEGPDVEVHHNDIRHHQQYVNGYALACACAGLDVHHNRVTSSGRGAHLTAEGIRFHDNFLDIYGHQQLDDIPQKSRPFKHHLVELHGIKFEGAKVRLCRVYGNTVRIVQRLPVDSGGEGAPEDKVRNGVYLRSKATSLAADRLADAAQSWEKDRWKGYFVKYSPDAPPAAITGNDATALFGSFKPGPPSEYAIYAKWTYVPATPLNIACYDPNAMNEIFGNTFVALTQYRETRHGGYGDSGQWAAAIYFVGMQKGPAEPGNYSAWIHDNRFLTNDLFAGSYEPVNMTIRIEKNSFKLAAEPPPTEGRKPFWRLGPALEEAIRAPGAGDGSGGNTLDAKAPY